jgi:transposase-like protein
MASSRQRSSSKMKFKVVLEVLGGEKTPGQIARAYGVHPNSVVLWKRAFLERGAEVFETGARRGVNGEVILPRSGEVKVHHLGGGLGDQPSGDLASLGGLPLGRPGFF